MELDEYRTKDLMEAAALICFDIKLLRLQRDPTFVWFVFSDKKRCEVLSDSYWSGELQVSAKSYALIIKDLKDRLFSRQ